MACHADLVSHNHNNPANTALFPFIPQPRFLRHDDRFPEEPLSMDDAIDAAVESHAEAFPASGCRESCIRAQLEDYYDRLCPGAQVNAKTQEGKPVIPTYGDTNG